MDIKDRIIQFIEYKNISINAFEKSIGASKSYISNTKSISAEVASNILRSYSDLNPGWLLTGEGSMLKENYSREGINANYNGTFHKEAALIVGSGNTVGGGVAGGKAGPLGEELAKLTSQNIKLQIENDHLKMSLKLKDNIIVETKSIIEMKDEKIKMLVEKIEMLTEKTG